MDRSNGYERIADLYIRGRGRAAEGAGSTVVRSWTSTLPDGAVVLDLGCGTGMPISKIFIDQGFRVYGVDASPSMVATFASNFPQAVVACEAVEDSGFFDRTFDAVVAWGLMFLLSPRVQERLIARVAGTLSPGGRFLFTAPWQVVEWEDAMTGCMSRSLGEDRYKALLTMSGLQFLAEWEDEGENHYFDAVLEG